jgi:tape measure domain-containing protein
MANRELNVVLGIKLNEFEKGLMNAQKKMERFAQNAQRLGQTLTTNLTLPILGAGTASVAAFIELERLEKGLAAVMGSSEAAAKEIELLREAAKMPGLGFEEAVKGSLRLQSVGLSADEARNTLTAFGAAIAATGGTAQNLESVQYQLTQMISKNRILQEDFSIIQENVPLVGKAIEAAFGTRNIEQIRQTEVSAQEFNRRIVEALKNLPETQKSVGGLGNSYENLKDSIKASLAEFGRSINESLKLEQVFEKIAATIDKLVKKFQSLPAETQKLIIVTAGIAAALGPAIFLFGKLASAAAAIPKVISVVSGVLRTLSVRLGAMAGPVGIFIALFIKMLQNSERLRNAIGPLFSAFGNLGKSIFEVGQKINEKLPVFNAVNKVFGFIGDSLATIIEGITGIINGIAELDFKKIGAGLLDMIGTGQFRKAFIDGKTFGESLGNGIKEGFLSTNVNQQTLMQMEGFAKGLSVGPTNNLPQYTAPAKTEKPLIPPPPPEVNENYERLLKTLKGIDNVAKEFGGNTMQVIKDKTGEAQEALQNALMGDAPKKDIDLIRAKFESLKIQLDGIRSAALNPIKLLDNQSLELASTQITSIKDANKEIVESMKESLAVTKERSDAEYDKKLAEQTERIQNAYNFIKGAITPIIDAMFTAIEQGTNVFKAVTDSIKKMIIQLVKAVAQAAIFAGIMALIPGGSAVGGFLGKIGIKTGAGSFGGNILKFLGLANGGLVTGPTLSWVGEGRGTSMSNPEVVAPLDKLKSMLDGVMGGGDFVASTRLAGSDLLLVVERAQRERGR